MITTRHTINYSGLFKYVLLLMLSGITGWSCSQRAVPEVHYQSAFEEVHVENGRLTYLTKTYHYPPDRPMVATPDSITTEVVVDAQRLSRSQRAALRDVIVSSNFLQLADIYGAPKGQRYYPYRLEIRLEERNKEVLYRSNPSYEAMPEPFATVQAYLLTLAERLTNAQKP